MLKELSSKQIEILSFMIKFYTAPQNEYLEKRYAASDVKLSSEYFKSNIEFYINKKLGVDRVYQSLFNAGSSFITYRYMLGRFSKAFKTENDERKAFMSFNEPFINSLIMIFSIFNELINDNKRLIINDRDLNGSFKYLDDLNNRISKSKIEKVRNGWTAHPFENKNLGLVYKARDIINDSFDILTSICHETYQDEFRSETDRLLLFCTKYLVNAFELNHSSHAQVHIQTKPCEMLIEMSKFSVEIKRTKLLNIEPFFSPSDDDIRMFLLNPKF